MAESKARITLKDVPASVKRMQTEGEKLVTRLQRDARAFATRNRTETVSSLLSDAPRPQPDLRKHLCSAHRAVLALVASATARAAPHGIARDPQGIVCLEGADRGVQGLPHVGTHGAESRPVRARTGPARERLLLREALATEGQ